MPWPCLFYFQVWLTIHAAMNYSSLGAGICFEAARYLKLHYNMQPVHMIISSAAAPQVSRRTWWLDKHWGKKIAWQTKRTGLVTQSFLSTNVRWGEMRDEPKEGLHRKLLVKSYGTDSASGKFFKLAYCNPCLSVPIFVLFGLFFFPIWKYKI